MPVCLSNSFSRRSAHHGADDASADLLAAILLILLVFLLFDPDSQGRYSGNDLTHAEIQAMAVQLQAWDDTFESLSKQVHWLIDEMAQRNFYRFSRSVVWSPAVNVYEDERRLYICAALAGMSRDDVHVDVIEGKIRIRGQRPVPVPPGTEAKAVSTLRMEIDSGPFEREIELPDSLDMTTISASLKSGFLWLVIDKRAT